uniref:SLATT domain-containing protein n=1 Tax=Elaeophora elaphi TaxID=1147741 RepID=A0A0R3RH06_9BILA
MFSFASNLVYMYDEATGSLMALTVYVFTYNWFMLHGNALTRARRTFLNIANVLDTYQIYNRKYGQFYESDPDTPGDAAETFKKAVTMSLGDIFKETTASTSDDRTKFEEAVKRHYAGVYQAVQRAEHELGTKSPIADELDTR